ncbi:MAG: GNAT family N-acetyltransferase [Rickettsiales bacterium]|jgi:ribosomal protein S18 acetylase RimI-like enzyme
MPGIKIRAAREQDTEAIAHLYVYTWRTTYAGLLPDHVLIGMKPERFMFFFARALKHRSENILVCEDNTNTIVAMGSAGVNRDRGSKFAGEVYTLYVSPDHQNTGIGERMLAKLFQILARDGCSSAVVWVLALNPSRFFYEAVGGSLVGDRDEQLWGTTLKEFGYGWDDLSAAITNGRPRLQD